MGNRSLKEIIKDWWNEKANLRLDLKEKETTVGNQARKLIVQEREMLDLQGENEQLQEEVHNLQQAILDAAEVVTKERAEHNALMRAKDIKISLLESQLG